MAEQVYAIMSGTTVEALVVATPQTAQSGWLGPYTLGVSGPGGPGWTTPDNGTTWVAPTPSQAQQNQATIQADVLSRQATIQAWIAANPTGAILTAAQTLVLAEMMNGLCDLLLQQYSSTSGT